MAKSIFFMFFGFQLQDNHLRPQNACRSIRELPFFCRVIEDYLQYIWKFQLFIPRVMKGTNGQQIEVVRQGIWNKNAGPDFKEGHIRIDGLEWHGHVEIHIKSSDWTKHRHDLDEAYNNVVLHVVWKDDKTVYTKVGQKMATVEIQQLIPKNHWKQFKDKLPIHREIACQEQWKSVSELHWIQLKDRMLVERMQVKARRVFQLLEANNGDWNQTSWTLLCRSFGFSVNADAFERLSQTVSVKTVLRYRDDFVKLKSLLLGAAGFLETIPSSRKLKQSFDALKYLLSIHPMSIVEWNHGKIHPANAPAVRILQLASFIYHSNDLEFLQLDDVDVADCVHQLRQKLINDDQGIKGLRQGELSMGMSSAEKVVFNGRLVTAFAFAMRNNRQDQAQRVIDQTNVLRKEKNRVVNKWNRLLIKQYGMGDSQALMHLYNTYCSQKKCLNCSIGVQILKQHGD